MRLSQVLVVIAASFLIGSEALSTSTDSNQVKLSEVASPSGHSQRLLRTHPKIVEDEDDSSEERAITARQWAKIDKYAEDVLKIDVKKAERNTAYLQMHPRYQDYLEKVNYYKGKSKNHGSPSVTYSENY